MSDQQPPVTVPQLLSCSTPASPPGVFGSPKGPSIQLELTPNPGPLLHPLFPISSALGSGQSRHRLPSGRLQQHRLPLLPPTPQPPSSTAAGVGCFTWKPEEGTTFLSSLPGLPSLRKRLSLLRTTCRVLQQPALLTLCSQSSSLNGPLFVPPTIHAHFYLRTFAHAIPAAWMLLFLRLRRRHLLRGPP